VISKQFPSVAGQSCTVKGGNGLCSITQILSIELQAATVSRVFSVGRIISLSRRKIAIQDLRDLIQDPRKGEIGDWHWSILTLTVKTNVFIFEGSCVFS